jgi:hypothetical protein
VIVDQLNIKCVASFEPKNNPPIRSDSYGPAPLAVAFELMEAKAGKIEGLRHRGAIKKGQDFLNPFQQVWPNPAPVCRLIQPFQATVPKTLNHPVLQ